MPKITKVAWDLSDLFGGVDDPAIDKALDDSLARAKAFAQRYRGRIDNDDLTPGTLLEAILEL